MKEKLYTIPLNDCMNANDECPFCYVEREVEHNLLDFVLGSGSSYMVSEIREQTDKAGFCRPHFKAMFDYGNTLGNAWILKTHYMEMRKQLDKEIKAYKPGKAPKKSFFSKATVEKSNSVAAWVQKKNESCYVCEAQKETYARYMDTFFEMYKKDPAFVEKVKKSKGFCLTHFGDVCEAAESKLNDKQREEFFGIIFPLMQENMDRLQEDVAWLVEKFDYKHKDDDWKNSKDANQRGMQKLKGGYPGDPVYQYKK